MIDREHENIPSADSGPPSAAEPAPARIDKRLYLTSKTCALVAQAIEAGAFRSLSHARAAMRCT